MKTLPIHECFYTWQGEGSHQGRSAFFIRTMGCPVHCSWCDSAGTWHPKYTPEENVRKTPQQLLEQAQATQCEFVVITGGEPAIHDLTELTHLFHEAGLQVHLETCGAFPLQGDFDWITLSPKWQALPTTENLKQANELKIIVENPKSIQEWVTKIGPALQETQPIWLHPEWSQAKDPVILNSISEWIKAHGAPYRAGLQAHKYYAVDTLDAGSQKPVPLGGNPQLGF